MPVETDLSATPYGDTFDPSSGYVRVLFKPGFPVQVRELNELQNILQSQVERFGDSVLIGGSVVSGCGLTFHDYYPYAKVADLQLDGTPVAASDYVGLFVESPSGLKAAVVNYAQGFESQDPNLTTLYLRYVNSGNTLTEASYTDGDVLTITAGDARVFGVDVPGAGIGTGFANTDTVTFVPAIVVNVSSSNTFSNGEMITQATSNARAQIIQVNSTAIAGSLVLKLRPITADISNGSLTVNAWAVAEGYNITSNTTASVANVVQVLGSGATGQPSTDGLGVVSSVAITQGGSGYYVPPYTVIKPANTAADVTTLGTLTARTYKAQITVSDVANSVGSGYAASVSRGWIYQKGTFIPVSPQTAIVANYSTDPDDLVLGFDTEETVATYATDATLLDNAGGTNDNAPGADRLKLEPTLTVISKSDAEANESFFPVASFVQGQPHLHRKEAPASDHEMENRLDDSSGDFVVDPFLITTDTHSANESGNFILRVDPGKAYVSGKKVETFTNQAITIRQGLDTAAKVVNSAAQMGSYVLVKELGGLMQYTTGDVVSLRDTAKLYLSNTQLAGVAPAGPGNELGKARIRGLKLVSGQPGTPNGTYAAYLFDVSMSAGKSFRNVRAISYSGSVANGVADVVTQLDPTSNSQIAVLTQPLLSQATFGVGPRACYSVPTVTYVRSNIKTNLVANNGGIIVNQLSASDYHPYATNAVLSAQTDVQQQVFWPLANAEASANLAGGMAISSTNGTVTRASGSFLSDVQAGAYLKLFANSTTLDVKRVVSVVNSTVVTVDSNCSMTNATTNAVVFFPAFVPVPIYGVTGRTVNVDSTGQILKFNLAQTLAANVSFASYHPVFTNASPAISKSVTRNAVVVIDCLTHTANTTGPWCLGIPEIVRLVSVKSAANVADIAGTLTDVTNEFYVSTEQNPDMHDLGMLRRKPRSSLALSSTAALVVRVDCLTRSSNGVTTATSYPIDDTLAYAALRSGTNINTMEVPVMVDRLGARRDCMDEMDFRPASVNTAVITTTVGLANVNPAVQTVTTRFGNTADPANVLRFPWPDTQLYANASYRVGRVDSVFVDRDGKLSSVEGLANTVAPVPPEVPRHSIPLGYVSVPAYPSVPQKKTQNYLSIADTGVSSGGPIGHDRLRDHKVSVRSKRGNHKVQAEAYTMAKIGDLDARVKRLELEATLSKLEANLAVMSIPSAVYASSQRFKFSVFADPLDDYSKSDVGNPEYSAEIVNGSLVPRKVYWNVPARFSTANVATAAATVGKMLTLPYTSVTMISQLQATTPSADTSDDPVTVRYVGTMVASKAPTALQRSDRPYADQDASPGAVNPSAALNFRK